MHADAKNIPFSRRRGFAIRRALHRRESKAGGADCSGAMMRFKFGIEGPVVSSGFIFMQNVRLLYDTSEKIKENYMNRVIYNVHVSILLGLLFLTISKFEVSLKIRNFEINYEPSRFKKYIFLQFI